MSANDGTASQITARIAAQLAAAGIEEAAGDARRLVCAALGLRPVDVIVDREIHITPSQQALLASFVQRRTAREPATRIIGQRGFWTFELPVRANVLDPRPDSEVLVETALRRLGDRRSGNLRILDLGTGSGAIVAALMLETPNAQAVAVDVSKDACAAARETLSGLCLSDRVEVLELDWRDDSIPGAFNLIVSNPPYIPTGDLAFLDPEVREYDPVVALDGGEDGLDAYRTICRLLPRLAAPDAVIALEIGHDQGAEVRTLVECAGGRNVAVTRDYAGRDRVVCGQWTEFCGSWEISLAPPWRGARKRLG